MTDKLVILDLDETLIHATTNKLSVPEDFIYEKYFIYKRPFLIDFLTKLSKDYKIGVWSSADDSYVQSIVTSIVPADITLEVVWGRSRCSYRLDNESATYRYEKRLEKLKKRGFRLEKILIVDDTHEKSRTNYRNAIHIKEFTGDIADNELLHLLNYLQTLRACENVRTIEKRYWKKTDIA